jgi:2-methylisocitrate lyase-like PEP mutase family enzyme
MSFFETFAQLHQQATPLLLGNIWNVQSARVFEAGGYKAIGTSSMAVARSLGYDDGENLPFDVLLQLAKSVTKAVNIPFTVDIEGGYHRTAEGIIKNISQLHDTGVAGINLEDTIPGTARELQDAGSFQQLLAAVTNYLSRNNLKVFVNVRTDGFLLGMPTALDETLTRVKGYENAGADGIFVPCITRKDDIAQVVKATPLPINVMCMPDLPDFAELTALGVKRISMGSFFFDKLYRNAEALAAAISNNENFTALFS